MLLAHHRKILICGRLGAARDADAVWKTIQYLVGFERLGFSPYYVSCVDPGSLVASAQFVEESMLRFGFKGRWHVGGTRASRGIPRGEMLRLFTEAEFSVCIGDAPVPLEIAPHTVLIESDRPPMVIDLWRPFRGSESDTLVMNLCGESLRSEDAMVTMLAPFHELPRDRRQQITVLLKNTDSILARELRSSGWLIHDGAPVFASADRMRRMIARASGRLVPASLSASGKPERKFQIAAHLACGRPVVSADSASSDDPPPGCGYFRVTTPDDAFRSIREIQEHYDVHSQAAAEYANRTFSHEVVLKKMLSDAGISLSGGASRKKADGPESNGSKRESQTGGRETSARRRIGHQILLQGVGDCILLATCLGDDGTGGGMFAYNGADLLCIDRHSSTGICGFQGTDGQPRLARLSWAPEKFGMVGEMFIYDRQGIEKYFRLPGVSAAHDILWDGSHFVIVSTGSNSVLWFDRSGELCRTWSPPGAERRDCWHLNSLWTDGTRVLVSAFGRFSEHKAWRERSGQRDGILFELDSGKDVISGLACPHHPRFHDGAWTICNSAAGELLRCEAATGQVTHRVRLNDFTRGIAVCDDYLFVGESTRRHSNDGARTASIAVLSRQSLGVVGRIALPCSEVYDLAVVPIDLLNGLQTGFRTNPLRVTEFDQYALFASAGVEPAKLWGTGERLAANACRVRIFASPPSEMGPGARVQMECSVENLGEAILVSVPPFPVNVSYKWLYADSLKPVAEMEGLRTSLPQSVPPKSSARVMMDIEAPAYEGDYILRTTLVQEQVAWFDTLDDSNSFESPVRIRSRDSSAVKAQTL